MFSEITVKRFCFAFVFFSSRPALRKRIVSLFVWTSAAAEKNTRSEFCHCLDPEAKSHKFELAPLLFCVLL